MLSVILVIMVTGFVNLLAILHGETQIRAERPLDIAVDTLREQCRPLAIRDRHHDVLDLLQHIPLETIQSDEDVAFWHALCLLSTVRYVEGKQAAEEFSRRYATPDNPLGVGRGRMLQSHLRIMDGDTEASYNLELEVVAILPETAYHERLRSWATIDTMAGHIGDNVRMEQAIEALADVRNNLPFDQSWWYSFVVPNRADILAKRGFLAKAETLLLAQLSSVPREEREIIKLRLAVIALEHQNPAKAREWLEDVSHDGPSAYWSMEAYLIASQIERLLGDPERALQILQDGIAEKAKNHIRAELFRAQIQLCELWIQEGEIELAEAWVSLASKALDPWPRTYGHPIPNMVIAELEMAKGNWNRAISLLEALRDEGIRRNHTGLLVGIYAHLAYAHASSGATDTAVEFVKLATLSGADGNFAKSLTVFGLDVRKFLTGSPESLVVSRRSKTIKKSLLSDREIEVLALVADGESNAEIADRLFLSISTVKNHLGKIFRSLGVSNRRDAVHAARQMGLLSNIKRFANEQRG